ncbi:MAG TPA: outer membrane beta-barrel protein [Flavisolibacter sp.]|nr:outer membrane beta-barrel protein [Flavisolibacter sp.]
MKKILLLTFVFLAAFTMVNAQGSVKGKLTDTTQKNPLGLATVTIFEASDTVLITYRLSNAQGEFRVPGLPLNKALRAVISYSGYEAFRKEFTLTDENALDLGTIAMQPSSKSLDEVLVIAERPPVTVKKDTIEFNASSFKTLPTSLVEDLLKKLPGVQVDAEGNITANGRKVNRIMVDGKAFFGDDPKMATRNLPANVIDKIQVTEDKDEANRNTDGDLSNVGQVINLTLKKGVKKGWFGKLYAGAGTDDRYEIGGIANIYRDTMQLSVLGFSNNLNRSGFSFKEVQDLGGFNRSGFNSVSMYSRPGGQQGFSLNGISFGGLDAGIARTSGAGFNLNHAPNKKKSFFLQYFFGNTENDIRQLNNIQQFLGDTVENRRSTTQNDRSVFTHNVAAGANLKPDSLTDITLRASYSYSATDENIVSAIDVRTNKGGLISTAEGLQFNNRYANSYSHSVMLTRRFAAKKGRTLNFSNFTNYNKNLQRYITESDNEFFQPVYFNRLFNQLRREDVPTLSSNLNLAYTEPLSKKWTLRWNNRYEYLKDKQDIGIYDKNASNQYENIDDSQSSGFERIQNRVATTLSLSYKIKQATLTAGLGGLWQHIDNRFKSLGQPIENSLFDILPSFSFNLKQLSASYNQNVSAPAIVYLNPVPDSTNPFNIRYGNPFLSPIKRHSFQVSNFNFFQGTGASYNFYINGNFSDNDVIWSRLVKPNGVQELRPVNAGSTANLYAQVGFGKEYKNKQKFIFSYRISPYFNLDKRRLIVNDRMSTVTAISFGPSVNIGLNWNDIVEFRPQYSPGFNRTSYTDDYFTDLEVITHYIETELIVRWPKKLVWETNLAYRNTNQVAPGLPKTNVLWNAAVTLLMLKNDVGLLKLSVFDILDRNNGFGRSATQNQIIDNQTNVLQRYAQLSFTYNIRNIGAPKKVGGRDRLFMF